QSSLVGLTVDEVGIRHHLLVVARTPRGDMLGTKGKDYLWHEIDSETKLAAGDQLVVCAEPRFLAPVMGVEEDPLAPVRWANWLRRNGRVIWRTLKEVDLPVKISTATLLGVVLASTLVYYLGDFGSHKKSLSDSLFRTVSLIATGSDMHEED